MQGNPQHVSELQPLARQVDGDMPDEKMTARAIAAFQSGLVQFMENALGPMVSAIVVSVDMLRCIEHSPKTASAF